MVVALIRLLHNYPGHSFLTLCDIPQRLNNHIMKILQINRTGNLLCLTIVSMLMGACASSLSYDQAMRKNATKIRDTARLDDARFLVDAKSYNLLALQLTELAITQGYAASVVTLAKQNHEDHVEMGKEIEKLARKEKVVLPKTMKPEHEKLLAELTASDRTDFDKNFIRIFKAVSEEDNSNFMNMATDAADADVRSFAARKLDLFKSHQTEFETVDAELLKTY
jgi:predicted outer membrane protein